MKYIEVVAFSKLGEAVERETGFRTRIELYTCKRTKKERKTIVEIKRKKKYQDPHWNTRESRERTNLLCDLICTLNVAYPDYDFTQKETGDFTNIKAEDAIGAVERNVFFKQRDVSGVFWEELDREIDMRRCDVFSFEEIAPSESRWSANYLFYNKKRKRVVAVIVER
ncbi:MAG: repressor of RNA polymerase III Maf1 [Amphiamblys sp. WSBS2006]|nr:MAG: repressor of RNA polymerase III Maf1 [Amphiamblys sp. WSBS2006]